MKKPKVSIAKKGAMFNILWLLVENPARLDYYRVQDIRKQLLNEFGIKLDYKTILDYLNTLMELELDIQIGHEYNKGYYVKKRIIDENERNVLFNALNSEKTLDMATTNHIYNFLTIDTPIGLKEKYFKLDERYQGKIYAESEHYNLINNLNILNEAIRNHRTISYEYLIFNKNGKFKPVRVTYYVIPFAIKYMYNMYYLMTYDKAWPLSYCGIKIKYMKNIQLLDKVDQMPYTKIDLDYQITLGIIYDWSIEFIDEVFVNYQLRKTSNGLLADIKAPYDLIFDFCRKYSPFYIIYDEAMKISIRSDLYELIDALEDKDPLILNIKGSICNFYYDHPLNAKTTYSKYLANLKYYIDNNILRTGFKKTGNIYTNGNYTMTYSVVEFATAKYDLVAIDYQKEFARLIQAKEELSKINVTKKYLVLLYGNVREDIIDELKTIFNDDKMNYIHDRFSRLAKSYFYNYDVFLLQLKNESGFIYKSDCFNSSML